MITLSVVIYIIFLLTSTSLFVVANTTIEPYLDGEYVKKNITIDPEHLKSRLEKVIEHDKTSHKREDANSFIEERNLLSSRLIFLVLMNNVLNYNLYQLLKTMVSLLTHLEKKM